MALLGIIQGCQTHDRSSTFNLEYTYLPDKQEINPRLIGTWKSVGNGYLLDATVDSIVLYSYTKSFCFQEKNDYLVGLLNSESQFLINRDTLNLYLTDYDDKTTSLQLKRDFVRINNLPNECKSYHDLINQTPPTLFNLFLETAKENYAFSDERSVDWDSLSKEYQSLISAETTTEELFTLLGEIVTKTKDHHTKIIAEDGRKLQYVVTPSAAVVIDSFNTQTVEDDLDRFFQSFFQHNYQNISDSLLHGSGRKTANQQIEWGFLSETVGYINIHAFAGFGDGITRKHQIDTLIASMDRIISELQHTDAMVIDVSFNFGGFDASVLTVASYFTDQPVRAYTSQVYQNGAFYNESQVTILPAKTSTYTKPIYLLMTDISRSAAEGFAMMMGELPHVKLVGMNTLGILSGMLGKSIGPFYLTLSNQRLINPKGQFFEVKGVPPDIPLNVFKGDQVFDGHKFAVHQLITIIEENQ